MLAGAPYDGKRYSANMVRYRDGDLFVASGLGGVNLEDIAQPKCFYILDTLRAECEIPIWHDDQQGSATVLLAGLLNALKVVGKPLGGVRIAMIGVGAANVATYRLLKSCGVDVATATPDQLANLKTAYAAMQGSGEFIHLVAFEHGLDHELGLPEEVVGCEGDLVHHFAASTRTAGWNMRSKARSSWAGARCSQEWPWTCRR